MPSRRAPRSPRRVAIAALIVLAVGFAAAAADQPAPSAAESVLGAPPK